MDLNKIKKIYFIGIGGNGISAAARILKFQGKEVVGSDENENEITKMLENDGIEVIIGQKYENVPSDAELVVYSVAVREDNPERMATKKLGIIEMTYPQLLGMMMADKIGIGVSGTNGKTTVTAMVGKILVSAGLDPTIIVGSKVDYLSGNSKVGKSDYFLFESDEYRRAFENYNPKIAVNTYIGEDHFDYYKDLGDIKSAFSSYFHKVQSDGFLIINSDDENSLEVSQNCGAKIITYGINNKADIMAKNLQVEDGLQKFDLHLEDRMFEMQLSIPGKFNVYNALAAIAVSYHLGVDMEKIKSALAEFRGAWRRFERLGSLGKMTVITDYAHTPDAISKTILAAKEFYPGKKVLVVFQPHQFSRTKNLFKGFSEAFSGVDKLIIPDIYYAKGREKPEDFDVNSQKLVDAIKLNGINAVYGGTLDQSEKQVEELKDDYDMALIMGAGDIYNLAKKIVNK
ncbi:MAG: UDP-N-acetylmuramate--L-alanine ligase [Candidatus Buchananbacteria bacterium]